MIGQTISHYRVLEKLGQGGMGEVYLAEDTRLDRKVALKILPEHLAERADLRERFEREARAVSSLNHPHICTLHDIGEQEGIHYLVMEHLEGQTLAERLQKRPLPLEKALEYAIQIADALDKAHRQGVVHRDLKPGNIMLTKAGAKLLDFGLAKLQTPETPTNLSTLPTEQADLTAEGTILGTLQYMAPEQLEGKEVDARTDIFAFGAVVYEMATGKKAFEGKSQASLIAAIMGQEPRPMSELQPMTPELLGRVVRKCLAKEPDRRWQNSGDLHDELRWVSEGSGVQEGSTHQMTHPHRRSWVLSGSLLAIGLLVGGLVVWSLIHSDTPRQNPTQKFVIYLDSDQAIASQGFGPVTGPYADLLAVTRDGTQVAFVGSGSDGTQLYLRRLDELEAKPLPGTEGASDPFFSPDNQWIGFVAGSEIKKVALAGGPAMSVSALETLPGAIFGRLSWGRNDYIVFGDTSSRLWRVSALGGEPEPLTTLDPDRNELSHMDAHFLPDSNHVVFTVNTQEASSIWSLSLDTGERRELMRGSRPCYVPTGHLIFQQEDSLFAVSFDPERLEVIGSAFPLPIKMRVQGNGLADFSVSEAGTLVYLPASARGQSSLIWVDREGRESSILSDLGDYDYPTLSPDGDLLVFHSGHPGVGTELWVYDLNRSTRNLLSTGGLNYGPVWTPDGTRVVFSTNRFGHWSLLSRPADGSSEGKELLTDEGRLISYSFSPDGQTLAFTKGSSSRDIWMLPSEGDPFPFLATPFNETAPSFSPNGSWLAYVSDESGRNEVYVLPFPGPGGKWTISTEGGVAPIWSHDGTKLFYRYGSQVLSVAVRTETEFAAASPQPLFTGPYQLDPAGGPNYNVSADNQRFVMIKPDETEQTQIHVITNWFEELKEKVPVP